MGQSARAAFSSMYVFADSLSSTTKNVSGGTNYFGTRWCNGPVWVEYVAQQQGITYRDTNNTSGFGFNSAYLTDFVSAFPAPPDATNSLFIVWAGASDLFWAWLYNNTNDLPWADSINQSMTNTAWIIQNLYSKGARSLVLPNAVDIGAAPMFRALPPDSKTYLHQKAIQFNTALSNLVSQTRVTLPTLTIYSPDLFTQFEKLLANPPPTALQPPTLMLWKTSPSPTNPPMVRVPITFSGTPSTPPQKSKASWRSRSSC